MAAMVVIESIRQAVRGLIRSPTGELTRAQRFARYCLDLTRHCARELAQNRAAQMAAALTYRTLFSLVPTAVLAMLMFRAFIGVEEAQDWFQGTAYNYLGLSAVALPDAEPGVDPDPVDEAAAARLQELKETADERLAEIVNSAWAHLKFGNIGAVGLLLLIWAALALAVTVEQCFNRIFRCPSGRAWHHRIAIYWAVVTLGPMLLFVSIYAALSVVHWAEDALDLSTPGDESALVQGATPSADASGGADAATGTSAAAAGVVATRSAPPSATARLTGRTAALAASWLLLFLTYVLMPNTRVHLRPAVIGSFVAACLWELAKWGFKLYVAKAVSVSAIYGSLGMVPLFLFWLYLTWLIVLFGLQLTYTLQAMHGRKFEIEELQRRQRHVLGDPRWILGMMSVIGRAFVAGRPVTADDVSQQLLIDPRAVSDIGEALEDAGLLHRVEGSGRHEGGYALALPPDQIRIDGLLDLGRSLAEAQRGSDTEPTAALLEQLDAAQREAAGNQSLADLVVVENEK